MNEILTFQNTSPSLESYWRSIILFGRNVASYKFALAKSLLEIIPSGQSEISLEALAEPFSRNLCEHLKIAPKQATSQSSQFLDSCKAFNEARISKEELLDVTRKKGFNNVIDAFHVVNDDPIPIQFYSKDYSGSSKKIILTDDLFKLTELPSFGDFSSETESRWNLVETAWELGVSRNLLNVQYDDQEKRLFIDNKLRRKQVTSAVSALNGYQKGKCFYCFGDIAIHGSPHLVCDVDHFYPYTLQPFHPQINFNGIWNLVLSCPNCNRGPNGKFARIPALKYLERLHRRNEFLISSHHPLRETIMNQTGQTPPDRIKFLKDMDRISIDLLIHRWGTPQTGPTAF